MWNVLSNRSLREHCSRHPILVIKHDSGLKNRCSPSHFRPIAIDHLSGRMDEVVHHENTPRYTVHAVLNNQLLASLYRAPCAAGNGAAAGDHPSDHPSLLEASSTLRTKSRWCAPRRPQACSTTASCASGSSSAICAEISSAISPTASAISPGVTCSAAAPDVISATAPDCRGGEGSTLLVSTG